MKCPKCESDCRIAGNIFKSSMSSEDVFSVQTIVCVNRRCELYAGTDLNNPLHIVKTIETKVSE